MILQETYSLANGVKIPKLALGTWLINEKDVSNAVNTAISIGYRHIDTAQAYENERGVGEGLRKSGIERKEIFITSKIAAEIKNYDDAYDSICKSLEKMETDYIDLMIIHCPQPWAEYNKSDNRYLKENLEVWRALEDALYCGKVKAIGVSNFKQSDIENILNNCRIKPMVNQILAHITNTPFKLIDYCKKQGIIVEAYSPIAHGEALKNNEIIKISNKYNVSPAQLCIRYCLEMGLVALPKSENPAHITNNSEVDFSISVNDMELLMKLDTINDYGDSSVFPVFKND